MCVQEAVVERVAVDLGDVGGAGGPLPVRGQRRRRRHHPVQGRRPLPRRSVNHLHY